MTRHRRQHPPVRRSGFTRGPRIADQMTPQLHAHVEAALAAERAGDAFGALEAHQRVPMFRRSAHRVLLTQLADLSAEMTPWMWARWAAYQATRAEDGPCLPGLRQAMHLAIESCYSRELDDLWATGGDPMQLKATVMGRSWVYHQLRIFDGGGLATLLDGLATGRLRDESDTAWEWTRAAMSGFRLESSGLGGLVVTDLATGSATRLLDLGGATHAGPGGWWIGRLVPSGVGDLPMLATRPLAVDEQTARAVASAPTDWLPILVDALDTGRVDRDLLDSEDHEVVSDVAGLALLERGTPPAALAGAREQLARGRDEIGRAAFRILRDVAADRFGPDDDAAYVAAAVVDAHAHPQAWRELATSTPPECWARWAELVPDPARGRLLRLASSLSAAS